MSLSFYYTASREMYSLLFILYCREIHSKKLWRLCKTQDVAWWDTQLTPRFRTLKNLHTLRKVKWLVRPLWWPDPFPSKNVAGLALMSQKGLWCYEVTNAKTAISHTLPSAAICSCRCRWALPTIMPLLIVVLFQFYWAMHTSHSTGVLTTFLSQLALSLWCR